MSIDRQILEALRAAPAEGVSGMDLSQRLNVSRAAIWARIRELRSLGYEILASPHLGYKLVSAPDLLHADDLLARLGKTRVLGRDIRVFGETTSTNDVVEKFARDGAGEGVAVFAERQTKGRGRLGREWLSPHQKGLWFSILLRPDMRPQEATRITICSAVALRRAIQNCTALPATIKWPNDILVHGKKLAGILTEMRAELDRVSYVILGIGVDVNLSATDFPNTLRKTATSVRLETGKPLMRAELAVHILRQIDKCYHALRHGDFKPIADEWVEHCATIGENVALHVGSRIVRGRAESINEDGALILRTEHGRLEAVTGGDVTLEKKQ